MYNHINLVNKIYKKLAEISQTEEPQNNPISSNQSPISLTNLEEGLEMQKNTDQFIKEKEDTQYNYASVYENLLKRKIAYLTSQIYKYSFVSHCPGHKNSQGEKAEWCIKDHNDGHIISSHKTEEEAKKHLRDMHTHK
mgnify:FL=1